MLARNLGIRSTTAWTRSPSLRGAAVFAGTQRLNTRACPVAAGEYSLTSNTNLSGWIVLRWSGKVSGPSTQDLTGFTLELVNTKTQWRSGKISLRPDGVFIANLHAERGERNTFAIELFDPSGRKQKTSPDTLTYTIGAVVEEQPLINSMGIALANNEYDKLCEKGRGLPLKTTRDYRTTHAIRQGQSADVFKIPVIEGELNAPTETVLLVCWKSKGRTFAATCDRQRSRSHACIDESRITVTAYVPCWMRSSSRSSREEATLIRSF